MDGILWYLLASSRGAESRVRILRLLDQRPQNANQLAETLDLDYTTVRYHLDILADNNIVEEVSDGYGVVFALTDQLQSNRETFEEILTTIDTEIDTGDDGESSNLSGNLHSS